MLDKRLRQCAEFVSGKGIVVDVGTDHALLPVELVKSGKCSKVFATDINEKPLESAKKNIEKNNLFPEIETILSDGLEEVSLEGVTDIVIAGMGGETIAEIIGEMNCDNTQNIRFILQPMTKIDYLRKMIYEYEMQIVAEKAVQDGDKIYTVMWVENNSDFKYLTEYESIAGFFEPDDETGKLYRQKEAERLERVADSLKKAGKESESVHYSALAFKLKNGVKYESVKDIYNYLDTLYPFSTQEKWDNSGLLVNTGKECEKVVLSLDITNRVISKAGCMGAELIISHHPVIFHPIKNISFSSPVYALIENEISAICMHTNLDKAKNGTNGVILQKLKEKFSISKEPEIFEDTGDGLGFGWIVELDEIITGRKLAESLKEIFGCEYIRITDKGSHYAMKRISFCSGSGGSMIEIAKEKNCQALITGDVKHDIWIDSNNSGGRPVIFDCGHFHTENLVLWELRRVLEEKFPQLDIEISDRSTDPCEYV